MTREEIREILADVREEVADAPAEHLAALVPLATKVEEAVAERERIREEIRSLELKEYEAGRAIYKWWGAVMAAGSRIRQRKEAV